MTKKFHYKRPKGIAYNFIKIVSKVMMKNVLKRHFIRNELKGIKTPYIILCNHESSLDALYLFDINKNRHTFVISKSFYYTLPFTRILNQIGVLEKQQFQTKTADLLKMKEVVDSGHQLVMYPAGLMTENGVATPIPPATGKFVKWMNVDVYVARVYGSYFVNPKWSKIKRRGDTFLDVYKLYSKEQLQNIPIEEIDKKIEEALVFDAYSEQEKYLVKYKNADNIVGLENVVYTCPICKKEFSIIAKDEHTLHCTNCGYTEYADEYGFLHCEDKEKEIRHISQWDYIVYNELKKVVLESENYTLSDKTEILQIDKKKHKFITVGSGNLSLNKKGFSLVGKINDRDVNLEIDISKIPIFPSSPGNYIELQHDDDIYRCQLNDGKLVVKFLHLMKIFYEQNNGIDVKYH